MFVSSPSSRSGVWHEAPGDTWHGCLVEGDSLRLFQVCGGTITLIADAQQEFSFVSLLHFEDIGESSKLFGTVSSSSSCSNTSDTANHLHITYKSKLQILSFSGVWHLSSPRLILESCSGVHTYLVLDRSPLTVPSLRVPDRICFGIGHRKVMVPLPHNETWNVKLHVFDQAIVGLGHAVGLHKGVKLPFLMMGHRRPPSPFCGDNRSVDNHDTQAYDNSKMEFRIDICWLSAAGGGCLSLNLELGEKSCRWLDDEGKESLDVVFSSNDSHSDDNNNNNSCGAIYRPLNALSGGMAK